MLLWCLVTCLTHGHLVRSFQFIKTREAKWIQTIIEVISLISICNIFSSLISLRITQHCDSVELLGNEQAGFRTLHVLIAICTKVLKKELHCCFVDYRKAFDSVPRIHLRYTLLYNGINCYIMV